MPGLRERTEILPKRRDKSLKVNTHYIDVFHRLSNSECVVC